MSDDVPEYLDSMGRRIGFAYRAVQALTTELLAPHGLSIPQWVTLTALWREDGLTVTGLASYTKATVPAASRLLGRMEEQGLVIRRPAEGNRRVVQVWLTDKSTKMRGLLDLFDGVNEMILEGFTSAERKRLAKDLERIAENAARHYSKLRLDDPLVLNQ